MAALKVIALGGRPLAKDSKITCKARCQAPLWQALMKELRLTTWAFASVKLPE